ncbi:MAG TPA: glycine zipper 2TM domain-containing protein [Caulobacteraceae bacterium]|nr:glycine zipper 2TM domain-containing protein [Caulobacteraceae bacterium]
MKTFKALALGLVLASGVSAAAAGVADARTCHASRHNAHVGTAVGAVGGGLLGNAVSHGGGRLGGTVIGAVAGGVVGHQIGKHSVKCAHGYYYRHGRRHYY